MYPEDIAIRREYSRTKWSRNTAWLDCQRRDTFMFGGFAFYVQSHSQNGWRKNHDEDYWCWYAERLYLDDVPRLVCPIPRDRWPNGYAWWVWTDYRAATCCGFVLVEHWQCGIDGYPPCPLGKECPTRWVKLVQSKHS